MANKAFQKSAFQIEGWKEIEKELKRIGDEAGLVLEDAVQAGAEIIRQQASDNAPVDEGDLANAIEIKTIHNDEQGVVVIIGADYKEAPHSHLVEFGTEEHLIPTDDTNVVLKILGRLIRKQIKHPGATPKPFLRPAFDEKIEEAEAAVAEELKRALGL